MRADRLRNQVIAEALQEAQLFRNGDWGRDTGLFIQHAIFNFIRSAKGKLLAECNVNQFARPVDAQGEWELKSNLIW